jgi:hypothetical protein
MLTSHKSNRVKWEFSATDANTVKTLSVYDATGTEITSFTGKQLYLTHATVICGNTAMRIDLFIDFNGTGTVTAGDRVISGVFAANGGASVDLSGNPLRLTAAANVLKVLSGSAAQCDVIAHGFIQ